MTPMRLPITVFDLHLTDAETPVAQFLREEAANRAVQFLKPLAEAGHLRGPDGTPIDAALVHYRAVTRDLDVDYPSLRATRAAGLLVDDDALQRQLQAAAPLAEPRAGGAALEETTP